MADLLTDDEVMGKGGAGTAQLLSDADVMGHAPSSAQEPKKSGVLLNIPAGVNDFIADVVGIPGNIAARIIEPRYWNSLPPEVKGRLREANPNQSAFMDYLDRSATQARETIGTPGIKKAMGVLGANPDDIAATSPGEKVARAAGEGIGSMVVPGLAAEAVAARAGAAGTSMLTDMLRGGGTVSNALMGGASGAGGEFAAEHVPEPWKPAAHMAGGLVAGGIVAAAEAGVSKVAKSAMDWAAQLFEPAEKSGARQILNRAANPDQLRTDLSNAQANAEVVGGPFPARGPDGKPLPAPETNYPEIVPGSAPTTFQATGDLGVGGLERDVAAKNNANAARFADRRADQNKARLGELETIADPAADPGAVTDYAKNGLQALTDQHAAQVAAATARQEEQAVARAAALDGLVQPSADGAAVTDYVRAQLARLTEEQAGQVEGVRARVAGALNEAGGASFDNAAGYGEAQRSALIAVRDPRKDSVSALWEAIDPDGTALVGNVASLRDGVAKIVADIKKTAKKPEGEEKDILDIINGLGSTESFGELTALRSRLTDAIRDERQGGSPTVLRRLGLVLRQLDNTLSDAVGQIAANPETRAPLMARLQADLETRRAGFDGQRARTGTGRNLDEGDAGVAPVGEAGIPPADRGEGAPGGRPGIPAGNQGVQEAPKPVDAVWSRDGRDVPVQVVGEPPITGPDGRSYQKILHDGQEGYLPVDELSTVGVDSGVLERYAAARAGTRDVKQTFEEGPVGAVLKPGSQYGSFKTTASNVAKNLFDSPERLEAFVRAANGDPAAMAAMRDYAAFDLRQTAVRDGMLSPERYQKWMDDHGYVLRQFPELRERFANVRSAQTALDEALATQKQAMTDFQAGAITKIVDGQDPIQVVGRALGSSDQFSALVARVAADPAAKAGLKRAAVEHMLGRSLSAGAEGPQVNVASFEKQLAQHRKTLSALFDEAELANMERVAAEIRTGGQNARAMVDDALGAQKQALTEHQNGVLKRFLDGSDPVQAAGAALKNPERFKELVAEVGKDERAFAGLKRAVADFILSKAEGTAEAGTSGLPQINAATLQKLYLQNRATLRNSGLFTREELDSLERVTADLQRANRSVVAVKIPGGSNTPQDLGSRVVANALQALSRHLGATTGAGAGGAAFGPLGAIFGAAAGAAADAMRAARVDAIDKAIVEMMLSPKMAAAWIEKIPTGATRDSYGAAFARRLRAVAASQVTQAIDEENRR